MPEAYSNAAGIVLAKAKRLGLLHAGDELSANNIHPLFPDLKSAKASIAELEAAGLVMDAGDGAVYLTDQGAVEARKVDLDDSDV